MKEICKSTNILKKRKQIKYEKQVADLAGTVHLEKQEKTFFSGHFQKET